MFEDKVKSFLKDESFIRFILEPSAQASSPWETCFDEKSEDKSSAEKAKAILLAPLDIACSFSEYEREELKKRIMNTIKGLV